MLYFTVVVLVWTDQQFREKIHYKFAPPGLNGIMQKINAVINLGGESYQFSHKLICSCFQGELSVFKKNPHRQRWRVNVVNYDVISLRRLGRFGTQSRYS